MPNIIRQTDAGSGAEGGSFNGAFRLLMLNVEKVGEVFNGLKMLLMAGPNVEEDPLPEPDCEEEALRLVSTPG